MIAGPHEEKCGICEGRGTFSPMAKMESDVAPGEVIKCRYCTSGVIKHACVLYTAFGGPPTPQEPDDPGCKDVEASRRFWAEHALARV